MADRRISDEQRRQRLVRRHHLGRTAESPLEVVRGVVAMHSSDPATPFLGLRARMRGFGPEDLGADLYVRRTLWRLHAMRRTLWIVPADAGAMFVAAAARAVASTERRRFAKWLEPAVGDPDRWLDRMRGAVLDTLGTAEASTSELSRAIPELATRITVGSGKWSAEVPAASRVLFLLALDGVIVRGRPAGTWRSSHYVWSATESWFGGTRTASDDEAARADLIEQYLRAFGPVTLTDVRWWTGWPARHARQALEATGAATVVLDGGDEGFVLADDHDEPTSASRSVALLPGLDPTPMGWKQRAWYLGDHHTSLFDRNGNVGPTVWLDGRIAGGWGQDPGGRVVAHLLESVGSESAALVAEEVASLDAWLDGTVVRPRFRAPLERAIADGSR